MARVLWRESFAEEDMAEVPAAVIAEDLGPKTIEISFPFDRTGDLIVKGRPPAFAFVEPRRARTRSARLTRRGCLGSLGWSLQEKLP